MKYQKMRIEWWKVGAEKDCGVVSFCEFTMTPEMEKLFNESLMSAIYDMRKYEAEMTDEEKDDGQYATSHCLDPRFNS